MPLLRLDKPHHHIIIRNVHTHNTQSSSSASIATPALIITRDPSNSTFELEQLSREPRLSEPANHWRFYLGMGDCFVTSLMFASDCTKEENQHTALLIALSTFIPERKEEEEDDDDEQLGLPYLFFFPNCLVLSLVSLDSCTKQTSTRVTRNEPWSATIGLFKHSRTSCLCIIYVPTHFPHPLPVSESC